MEQNGNPLNAQNGNVQIEEVEIGNVDDNNVKDVQWKLTMQVVSTENTEIEQNAAADDLNGNKNENGHSNSNGDENKKTDEHSEQKKRTFVDELRNEPLPECETKG